MRKLIALLVCALFVAAMMVAGCSKKEEPTKPAAKPAQEEPAKAAEPEKKAEESKPAEEVKPEAPAPESVKK